MTLAVFVLCVTYGLGLEAAKADDPHARPMMVLSDTESYCIQLETELTAAFAATPPSAQVRSLADNGERMCRDGAVRAGIARLRRAMLFLRAEHAIPP